MGKAIGNNKQRNNQPKSAEKSGKKRGRSMSRSRPKFVVEAMVANNKQTDVNKKYHDDDRDVVTTDSESPKTKNAKLSETAKGSKPKSNVAKKLNFNDRSRSSNNNATHIPQNQGEKEAKEAQSDAAVVDDEINQFDGVVVGIDPNQSDFGSSESDLETENENEIENNECPGNNLNAEMLMCDSNLKKYVNQV